MIGEVIIGFYELDPFAFFQAIRNMSWWQESRPTTLEHSNHAINPYTLLMTRYQVLQILGGYTRTICVTLGLG